MVDYKPFQKYLKQSKSYFKQRNLSQNKEIAHQNSKHHKDHEVLGQTQR
ncbi:hypothetical protein LEP1GSC039_2942 [Leptospira santarosai str. 2000027870]|nr:hypothetical protein LEP1GSC039_2942 [Leptospira santarosai str. 2000027870]